MRPLVGRQDQAATRAIGLLMPSLLGHEEEMAETAVVIGQPSLVSTTRALGRTLKGLARLTAGLEVETLDKGR